MFDKASSDVADGVGESHHATLPDRKLVRDLGRDTLDARDFEVDDGAEKRFTRPC
jgi:hypothetical protein